MHVMHVMYVMYVMHVMFESRLDPFVRRHEKLKGPKGLIKPKGA